MQLRTCVVWAHLILITGIVVANPAPRDVLAKASAALEAVQAVRYEARGEPAGLLSDQLPEMEGTLTMVANPGQQAPKLRLDARFTRPGEEEAARLQVAFNGQQVTLTDHSTKAFARQPMPHGAQLLGNTVPVLIRAFVIENPLQRESNAPSLKYIGTETVAGVDCDVVHVGFVEGGDSTRWWFARSDHLPRQVVHSLKNRQGEGSLKITLSALEVDPQVSDDVFALEKPSGYRSLAEVQAEQQKLLPVGKDAPGFTLKNHAGDEVSLEDLRGKVVLLDFWATWCGPCRMAMPQLQALHEKYKDDPVVIYGVNCWERNKRADPVKFMRQQRFTYPLLVDGNQVARKYRVRGIPTLYVIGPEGKILLAHSGVDVRKHAEPLIESQLKKLKSGTGRK